MKSPSSLLYFKYFRYNVSPPPVQRGIDHETKARQDYLTTIKPYTKTQKYIYQELHCSKKHSSFGASSDGRVIGNENTG